MQDGSGPTCVLESRDKVYVGCNGRVYRFDYANGTVKKTADLGTTTGYREVHLALDKDLKCLFVGTHGYGACIGVEFLERKYLKSLPGSGHSVTHVTAKGDKAFFANNGRVFQLDANGDVVGRNDLDGYGDVGISLAMLGADRLIVGPDGLLCRDFAAEARNRGRDC